MLEIVNGFSVYLLLDLTAKQQQQKNGIDEMLR